MYQFMLKHFPFLCNQLAFIKYLLLVLLISGKNVICWMLLFTHFVFNFFLFKYDFFPWQETLKIAIETVQEFNVAGGLDTIFQ